MSTYKKKALVTLPYALNDELRGSPYKSYTATSSNDLSFLSSCTEASDQSILLRASVMIFVTVAHALVFRNCFPLAHAPSLENFHCYNIFAAVSHMPSSVCILILLLYSLLQASVAICSCECITKDNIILI
uniref:Uncharacterized protein n=1 Tax=Glossina brevipalpis TaxID=37001 RepID=A0A1A9W0W4_9MUSC